ncbi:MAG: hypothetical protein K2I47_05280 [Odoribacter sp.]|nr:hypothetical protein [Odoribacter sp.]
MEIKEVLDFLTEQKDHFEYTGNEAARITCISSLNNIKINALCWIKNENYLNDRLIKELKDSEAVVVTPFVIDGVSCILTKYPKATYFSILDKFFSNCFKHTVSETATVFAERIGNNVHIGSNCFINRDVSIGDNTVIYPNVSILCPCKIGDNCIIFSGAVIGADGFGYYYDDRGLPVKVGHFGGVQIGSRVEIGANTCIDRGTIGNTIICDDVKIDNLVHIAHNTVLEKGSVIIAGSIICGSAVIGQRGYVAPGAIIKNQISIGSDALVGLGAIVTKNVDNNMVVVGIPAKPMRAVRKGDK